MANQEAWKRTTIPAIIGIAMALLLVSMGPRRSYAQSSDQLLLSPTLFNGGYTFESSDCLVAKDPIGVVFYNAATSHNVYVHSQHHAWNNDNGLETDQYFWFDGKCEANEGQLSTPVVRSKRYHMRWHSYSLVESMLGTIAVATPHLETLKIGLGLPPWAHCVDASVFDFDLNVVSSGFLEGKWELGRKWHTGTVSGEDRQSATTTGIKSGGETPLLCFRVPAIGMPQATAGWTT